MAQVGAAFSAGVALLEEAARRQLNLREALAWLCAAEVASKEQRRLSMAMTIAHFPFVRTLEGFEFESQPSIDPGKIRELATCRWVANGDNVVLLGPPGVGRTHLEVALGREAVARGYTVQFTTAMELLGALVKGQQQGALEVRLGQYAKPKLLIVDELGYLPVRRRLDWRAHAYVVDTEQPAAGTGSGAPVLPADLAALRAGERADQLQPPRRGLGRGVRRPSGGGGDPGSAAALQPRGDDPRRQLSAEGKAHVRRRLDRRPPT